MANVISIIIGLLCSPVVFLGMIPLLGWMNWLMLPGATLGAIIGAFSENKAGLIINVVVLIVGGFRLFMGGGVI
ncbi:MAG: hypothetical protein CMF59_09775 [Leptospiraceae bacterium]|nr:hypothetical protein [Leptospiraceae bacterium]MBR32272.1 hypothetical protein [Spirochaetaceae bacterium]|tara:strand:+ start:660 stop:881 length:222 start_codon:yes stop_codon:yes gene_type:complete